MQTQNETIDLFSVPDGTRCHYCLKMSDGEPMHAVRPYNLKTGQSSALVFVCAQFSPCAQRRHMIRAFSK